MRSSSIYQNQNQAKNGRLNGNSAWCAESRDGNQDWLEIELEEITEICGVATQGEEEDDSYVIDFKLSYSSDGSGWTTYKNSYGSEKVGLYYFFTRNFNY